MPAYSPKPQFEHQKTELDGHWADTGRAWFWEQGTGKTKEFVDNAGILYCDGGIDRAVLVAPNGLHRQFVERELPKHMPEEVLERTRAMFWRTERGTTKWQAEEARDLLAHRGLKILGLSYDGMMTEPGKKLLWEFLKSGSCLYGLDESQRIKEPGASRSKRALASSPYAKFRRVLSGTPVSGPPWDVYSQVKFCEPTFWQPHALDSIEAMRTQFGEWTSGIRRVSPQQARWPSGQLKRGYEMSEDGSQAILRYPKLVTSFDGTPHYRDVERLEALVRPIRSRVLKDEVFDLPPKLYSPLEFDLAPAQRKAYESLKKLGFVMLEGHTMTAPMALTLMLRLQQIACGYIVTDLTPGDEEPTVVPMDPNPRAEAMLEITEDLPHQAIIWARFRHDIDLICRSLHAQGKTFARYDGAVSDEEAAENEARFHRGEAQFFVGTAAKGGEGLTLTEAKTVIYYSNTFKLIERLQSEDRPHRWGQDRSVNYIDLIARDTLDWPLINRLRSKMEVSSMVLGDAMKEWLGR